MYKKPRRMNFLVWLLIAFLAGLFIWLLLGQQKAVTSMAMSASAYPQQQGTGLMQNEADPTDVPAAALSSGPTGRPICQLPLDPCVGQWQNGFMQGDRGLYVGSYLSPLYFNTGAWRSCAEDPASCLNC